MIDFSQFNSVISVINYFHDEKACKDALAKARWGVDENGETVLDVVCPRCGHHHCVKRASDGRFHCKECGLNFSVTVGTIFENTKLPLQKWFVAMYLVSSHKKGISSWQLSRDLGVRQATAWFMLQKIRSLFQQTDEVAITGDVEADIAFIGGSESNKHDELKREHSQGGAFKQKVLGIIERETGRAVAVKVDNGSANTIRPIMEQFCDLDSLRVSIDTSAAFAKACKEMGVEFNAVNHSKGEYVRGNVFTNSVDGFWSHFNRMIIGCYHQISDAYLQRYLDEQCFRWNTRKENESNRFSYMFKACVGKFTYADVLSLSTVIPLNEAVRALKRGVAA